MSIKTSLGTTHLTLMKGLMRSSMKSLMYLGPVLDAKQESLHPSLLITNARAAGVDNKGLRAWNAVLERADKGLADAMASRKKMSYYVMDGRR